ncbi:MAG: hypothetical protein H6698_02935 [Myxococcales bacterium]|nr:hypothetical protein [Myxococcales bacterium]MCB9519505.1 hypothetical protein [Myxococcales bacterium]MCB9533270.1 hypothetical protein [Myxococcales bacterium]
MTASTNSGPPTQAAGLDPSDAATHETTGDTVAASETSPPTAANAPKTRAGRHALTGAATAGVAVVVAIIGTAAFARGLRGGFVFDDYTFLKYSCWQVTAWGDVPGVVLDGACRYRPLRYLSLAVDHVVWGRDPYGYHATNLALHACCSALVAVACARVVRRLSPRPTPWAVLCGAAAWAVHPVHADAVAYVSGRRDLLAALFYLAAFVLAPIERRGRWRERSVLAGAAFALALASKEVAVTLPVVVLAFAAAAHVGSGAALRDAFARWRGQVAVAAAGLLVAAGAAVYWARATGSVDLAPIGGSWATHLATLPAIYGAVARWSIAPTELCGDYESYAPVVAATDGRLWLGVCAVAFYGVALGAALRRGARDVAFGLMWVGVAYLPMAQLVPHHERLAEHYAYLPFVGLAFAASAWGARTGPPRWAVVGLAGALLFAVTQRRVEDYATRESFARAIIARAPQAVRGRILLADALQEQGRVDEALQVVEDALRLAVVGTVRWGELGIEAAQLRATRGDRAAARAAAESVLRELPGQPEALAILGTLDVGDGDVAVGVQRLQLAVAARPSVQNLTNLAVALVRAERLDDADEALGRAAERAPLDPAVWARWGEVAFRRRDAPAAELRLERAVTLDPADLPSRVRLVQLYNILHRPEDAARHQAFLPAPPAAPPSEVQSAPSSGPEAPSGQHSAGP